MKILIITILAFSKVVLAQPDSIQNNLVDFGLNDLINSALRSNLNLEPIEYENKILLTKINQLNKQSSPMLQFMIDYLPVNLQNAGEYSFILTQPLKLFGKLDAEESLARLNIQRTVIDRKELENELIKSIKENYFMLSINERLLEFNHEFQEILNSMTKSIEIKYSVGKGSQYEIMKSNNEFQKILLEEIELNSNKNILINNLKILSNLNLPDNYRTKSIEILMKISPLNLDTIELIKIMQDSNPGIQSLRQLKQENILEKHISKLERNPDVSLSSGYRYLSESKTSTLLFSISFDLPFAPWNSRRIDAIIEEKNLIQKISSETKSFEQDLKNDLRNTILKIKASLEKINFVSSVLIPQTEQTFKSALISYETSSVEFIDLLDTYRSLRENNKMFIEEETNYLILISSIEKIIGRQILTIN